MATTPHQQGAILEELISFARAIARYNHLVDNPLPANTDVTEEDNKALQAQLNSGIPGLPPALKEQMYFAFSAHHLSALADSIRSLNPETQPIAFSNAVQIWTLLPEPKHNLYLRKFLRSSEQIKGVPDRIASAFAGGILEVKRPSGFGLICSHIMYMLQWCDVTLGDDAVACIPSTTRQGLADKTKALMEHERFKELPRYDQVEVSRLEGMLKAGEMFAKSAPYPGYYYDDMRKYLESTSGDGDCPVCMEEGEMACSKCKVVRYCGAKCQKKDWKKHKGICFETTGY